MNAYNKLTTKHFDRNDCGQLITPDLAEFIAEFADDDLFITPEGSVEPNDLMEHIHCFRQEEHEAIQMDALKGKQVNEAEAAKKWFKLVKLMNDAAAAFYKDDIVPDYQNGDL